MSFPGDEDESSSVWTVQIRIEIGKTDPYNVLPDTGTVSPLISEEGAAARGCGVIGDRWSPNMFAGN